jgi:hypothetical protein
MGNLMKKLQQYAFLQFAYERTIFRVPTSIPLSASALAGMLVRRKCGGEQGPHEKLVIMDRQ